MDKLKKNDGESLNILSEEIDELNYVDKSINTNETFMNDWIKDYDKITEKFMLKLKYNHVINSFFFF